MARQIGRMRERITLVRPTTARTDAGEQAAGPGVRIAMYAEDVTGKPGVTQRIPTGLQAKMVAQLRIRWRQCVTPSYTVEGFQGTTWRLDSVWPDNGRRYIDLVLVGMEIST